MSIHMKYIDRQKNNIELLLNLIKENPELEIVPMVDGEVCQGDEYSYWMGKWGSAIIDQVYHSDDRIYFLSGDEEELIERQADYIFDDEFPTHQSLNEKDNDYVTQKAKKQVRDLPWKKSIVVYIDLP